MCHNYFQLETIFRLYKLTDISLRKSHGTVRARQIKTGSWLPLYALPDFNKVGIFTIDGYEDDLEEINVTDLKGKVVLVGTKIAVTVPKIVLDEAT